MKKTRYTLLAVCLGSVAVSLLMAALYESDTLAVGALVGYDGAEFVLASAFELVSIAVIPIALRLFKMRVVRRSLASEGEAALLRWGVLRLLLLCVPLVANTLLYYLFMSPSFGYMAIILFLCLFFVYPSKARCHYELNSSDSEDR